MDGQHQQQQHKSEAEEEGGGGEGGRVVVDVVGQQQSHSSVSVQQQEPHAGCSSSADGTAVQQPDNNSNNNDGLDEALEVFACSYNLTAQNVKNIVYHIVKNPQTFATLVRKDPDAMAGLRMTRARLRQLERIARRRIPSARLRPIVRPKTFLDINYGDDDDAGGGGEGGGAKQDGTAYGGGQQASTSSNTEPDMDYSPANDPTATTATKRRVMMSQGRDTCGKRCKTEAAHTNSDESPLEEEEEEEEEAADLTSDCFSSDTDHFGGTDEEEEQQQQEEQGQDKQQHDGHHGDGDGSTGQHHHHHHHQQQRRQLCAATIDEEVACPNAADELLLLQLQPHQQQRHELKEEEGQSVEFLTKVDNPIYPMFIKSLATEAEEDIDPEVRQHLYEDEDNDPEYVFPNFDDWCDEQEEDEYEFRKDRATEIPRWEVKALEQDFEDGDEPSPLEVPVEPLFGDNGTGRHSANGGGAELGGDGDKETTIKIHHQQQHSNAKERNSVQQANDGGGTTTAAAGDDMPQNNDNNSGTASSMNCAAKPNPSASCSLLTDAPTVDQLELAALKVQLEKHVQLLCQAIVGTSQYPTLVEPHNSAMLMLRELDALSRERDVRSVFNVPTLEAAIYSTHDAKACREVNLGLATPVDHDVDAYQKQLMQRNSELRPSSETMWVLSRSGAIRYPELLCPYRFDDGCTSNSNSRNDNTNNNNSSETTKMGMASQPQRFLHSEQLLLAIGLYQLNGVPPRHGKMFTRYKLLQQNFLPTKRIDQIRNHIRNARTCPSPTIYHKLIMEAKKGHFPVTYRPDLGKNAQRKVPIEWPNQVQLYWLKWLSSVLSSCQIQMIMVDDGGSVASVAAAADQQRSVGTSPKGTGTILTNNKHRSFVVGCHNNPRLLHPSSSSSANNNNNHLNSSSSSAVVAKDDNNKQLDAPTNSSSFALYKRQQQQQQRQSDDANKTTEEPRALSAVAAAAARKRCLASSSTMCDDDNDDELHGHIVGEQPQQNQQQQQQCVVVIDEDQMGGMMETRLRKRIRTTSSTTTTTEDGGNHAERSPTVATAAVTMDGTVQSNCSGGSVANGTVESALAPKMMTLAESNNTNNNKGSENCTQQKKSRRHERAERGMAALCDARARAQTERALAAAIYEDFKKRMFMHQDKLRAVQRLLSSITAVRSHDEASSSPSLLHHQQCFTSLWQLMGLTHPQLFHLFAAIAPEAHLPPTLRTDPHWQACKRALGMLNTIHTYLSASRTPAQMKHMLKFLKEASPNITSEQHFFEALQRQFSIREESLWRLLRREWMGAKFVEMVEDWEYEFVDMDNPQQQCSSSPKNDLSAAVGDEQNDAFEHVRLPYRRDPSERSRLRLRHGRVTAEMNGRLCNVAIVCTPSTQPSSSIGLMPAEFSSNNCSHSTTAHSSAGDHRIVNQHNSQQKTRDDRLWTRKMDMELMLAYKSADGDAEKCVSAFLLNCSDTKMGAKDVEQRLTQLLNVANTLTMRKRKERGEQQDRK